MPLSSPSSSSYRSEMATSSKGRVQETRLVVMRGLFQRATGSFHAQYSDQAQEVVHKNTSSVEQ